MSVQPSIPHTELFLHASEKWLLPEHRKQSLCFFAISHLRFVFLFESVTLPYPVIVLTDSALSFSYLFCNFDMTQVTWYCQRSSDKDKLTFRKPWIVSTIAIWNSASSIMNAQIVSTFSFFLPSWTQHLYLVNIFCHFLLQVVVQSSIAKFFCSFGFF